MIGNVSKNLAEAIEIYEMHKNNDNTNDDYDYM